MMEAENLIRLTTAATPLHGGDNPELNPSDFSGSVPKRSDLRVRPCNLVFTNFLDPQCCSLSYAHRSGRRTWRYPCKS